MGELRVAPAAAGGVGTQRDLELVSQAEPIHHQAVGLVAEHTVHPGDGLQQPMASHGLVKVHGKEARGHENVWQGRQATSCLSAEEACPIRTPQSADTSLITAALSRAGSLQRTKVHRPSSPWWFTALTHRLAAVSF